MRKSSKQILSFSFFKYLRILLIIFALFVNIAYLSAAEKIISVNTQEDFNGLNAQLNAAVNNTKNSTIKVVFKSGSVFKFNDANQISIVKKLNRSDLSLVLTASSGDGNVNIISDGNEYNRPSDYLNLLNAEGTHYAMDLKSDYTRRETYVDQDFNMVPIIDSGNLTAIGINTSTTDVESVDTSNPLVHISRMGIPPELRSILNGKTSTDLKNNLLYFKSWFRTYQSKIQKIENNYIYFYHNPPSDEPDAYEKEFNGDRYYSEDSLYPQFYITNLGNKDSDKAYISGNQIFIPKNITKLYECKYQIFLGVDSVEFNEIEISNLTFSGSALAKHASDSYDISFKQTPLIILHNAANTSVTKNKFRNIGNLRAIQVGGKESSYEQTNSFNHFVEDNKMYDSYGFLLYTFLVKDISVQNNETSNTGLFHKFGGVIEVLGMNYLIKGNTTTNFSYAGIRVGGGDTKFKNSGTIEENLVYNKEDYFDNFERHTIMDGGGIYIWTNNDSVVCQNNVIQNIQGRKDYRGIFCDDGAYNFTIRGNLIYNSDKYRSLTPFRSIDSYIYGGHTIPRNTNNVIEHNIVMDPYKFESFGECEKGTNYVGSNGLNEFSERSYYTRFLPDIVDPFARVDKDQVILYGDIPFYESLSTLIKSRIVLCKILELNTAPLFKASNNFMRLNLLSGNGYTALNGYENSSYSVQDSNITPSGVGATRWITAYKLNEDIEIKLNDEFQISETKFAIIGTPYNEGELRQYSYPVNLTILKNGVRSELNNVQILNPIYSGINDLLYIRDGNIFRTEYMPMNQLKGIVFEALATSDIKLGVEVKCISKLTGKPHILRESFPILKDFINPTHKYLTLTPGIVQSDFLLSSYWASVNDPYLSSPTNSTYIARTVTMENGFVGRNGFAAKASYTKNEIGNTRISFIERCEGQYMNRVVSRSGLYSNQVTSSSISDLLFENSSHPHVYPNPSDGIFYVGGLETECDVDVYDISGKKVYSAKILKPGDQIDMQGKPKGIYMAQININGKVISQKVIVK